MRTIAVLALGAATFLSSPVLAVTVGVSDAGGLRNTVVLDGDFAPADWSTSLDTSCPNLNYSVSAGPTAAADPVRRVEHTGANSTGPTTTVCLFHDFLGWSLDPGAFTGIQAVRLSADSRGDGTVPGQGYGAQAIQFVIRQGSALHLLSPAQHGSGYDTDGVWIEPNRDGVSEIGYSNARGGFGAFDFLLTLADFDLSPGADPITFGYRTTNQMGPTASTYSEFEDFEIAVTSASPVAAPAAWSLVLAGLMLRRR